MWELQLLYLERREPPNGQGAKPLAVRGAEPPAGRAGEPPATAPRSRLRLRDFVVLARLALRLAALRLPATGRRRSIPFHRTS